MNRTNKIEIQWNQSELRNKSNNNNYFLNDNLKQSDLRHLEKKKKKKKKKKKRETDRHTDRQTDRQTDRERKKKKKKERKKERKTLKRME